MKSILMVYPLLLMFCAGLMSCSNSDTPVDGNSDVSVNGQSAGPGEVSFEDSPLGQYIGTWKSDCIALSTAEAKLVTFIYDGQRAALITEFHDSACSSALGFELRNGSISFQDPIIDTAFGVIAHPFVFEDDTAGSNFQDLLYIKDNLLYFGDPETKPSESESPTGLDLSQPFRNQGKPDFSVLDDIGITTLSFVVERFDGATADDSERAISTDALNLSVMVNGELIPMMFDSSVWTGSITVDRDSTLDIEVQWDEIFEGNPLPIAHAATTINANEQIITVQVVPDSYIFSFDDDGDGVSNIDERNNGTNPLDANSN